MSNLKFFQSSQHMISNADELEQQISLIGKRIADLKHQLEAQDRIAAAMYTRYNASAKAELNRDLPKLLSSQTTEYMHLEAGMKLCSSFLETQNGNTSSKEKNSLSASAQRLTYLSSCLYTEINPLLRKFNNIVNQYQTNQPIYAHGQNGEPSAPSMELFQLPNQSSPASAANHSSFEKQTLLHEPRKDERLHVDELTVCSPNHMTFSNLHENVQEISALLTRTLQNCHALHEGSIDPRRQLSSQLELEIPLHRDKIAILLQQCTRQKETVLQTVIANSYRANKKSTTTTRNIQSAETTDIIKSLERLQQCELMLNQLDAWQVANSHSGSGSWALTPGDRQAMAAAANKQDIQALQINMDDFHNALLKYIKRAHAHQLSLEQFYPLLNSLSQELSSYCHQTQLSLEPLNLYQQKLLRAMYSETDPYLYGTYNNLYNELMGNIHELNDIRQRQNTLATRIQAEINYIKAAAQNLIGLDEKAEIAKQIHQEKQSLQTIQHQLERFQEQINSPRNEKSFSDAIATPQDFHQMDCALREIEMHNQHRQDRLGAVQPDQLAFLTNLRASISTPALPADEQSVLQTESRNLLAHATTLRTKLSALKHMYRTHQITTEMSKMASDESSKKLLKTIETFYQRLKDLCHTEFSRKTLSHTEEIIIALNGNKMNEQLVMHEQSIIAKQNQLAAFALSSASILAECGPSLSEQQLQTPPLKLSKPHASNLIKVREKALDMQRLVREVDSQLANCLALIQAKKRGLTQLTFSSTDKPLTSLSAPPKMKMEVYSAVTGLPVTLAPTYVSFKPLSAERKPLYTHENERNTVRQMITQSCYHWGWQFSLPSVKSKSARELAYFAYAYAEALMGNKCIDWDNSPLEYREFANTTHYLELVKNERQRLQNLQKASDKELQARLIPPIAEENVLRIAQTC